MSTRNYRTETAAPTNQRTASSATSGTKNEPPKTGSDHQSAPRTSASELAPQTFSKGRTRQLENLIDEWNSAFLESDADTGGTDPDGPGDD